jgi:hypothetical protein
MIKTLRTEEEITKLLEDILGSDENTVLVRKEWYKSVCITLYGTVDNPSAMTHIIHPEDVWILLENAQIRDTVMSQLTKGENVTSLLNWWDRNATILKAMDTRRKSIALTFMSAALFVNNDIDEAVKTTKLAAYYSTEWGKEINNDSLLDMLGMGIRLAVQSNETHKLRGLFINSLNKCAENIDDTLVGPRNVVRNPREMFDALPKLYAEYDPDFDPRYPALLMLSVDVMNQAKLERIDVDSLDASEQYMRIINDAGLAQNVVVLLNNCYKDTYDLDVIFDKTKVDWRSDFREVMWANHGRAGSMICTDSDCCPSEGVEISSL